jgi:hypothetical protein
MAGQRPLVLTGNDAGFSAVAALTVPVMRRYAERHGFAFHAELFQPTDRVAAWSKVPAIQNALASGFDPVVWIDADALIVRSDLSILDGSDPEKDLFITPIKNTGVLLVRNTPWSVRFLERLWHNQLVPEHHTWDNAAFLHLIGHRKWLKRGEDDCPDQEMLSHIGRLDSRWNVTPMTTPAGDAFIRHYAGIPLAARIKLIRNDIHIPYFGKYLASPLSYAAFRFWTFDDRMKRKAETAKFPLWYKSRQLARRAVRAALSPIF